MSVKVNYKGNEILSANTDVTKTLKTSGKYCEADIEVVNTQDGGITPSGNINITDLNQTDVTNYATAQVADADLVAANIKKDVNILGVVGSFEGSGGGGLTLLGSGIYNKASATANLNCPVSWEGGTPKLFYAVNTTPPADTNQLIFGARWVEFDDEDIAEFSGVGFPVCRIRTDTNILRWSVGANQSITLSDTEIYVGRPTASSNAQAGEWHWYIYGEASST